MLSTHLAKLQKYLSNNDLDVLIVSKKENIFYYTQTQVVHPTNREALLIITKNSAILLHSSFLSPTPNSSLQFQIYNYNNLREILIASQAKTIGIEDNNLTVAELKYITNTLPSAHIKSLNNSIDLLRLTKDKKEIKNISKACSITHKTMIWIINYLKSNQNLTEQEVKHLIENRLHELGSDNLAFPTIVAFDTNSSLPHHMPNKAKLKQGIILMDFGCKVGNYCSDMTRTICVTTPPPLFTEIKTIVKTAHQKALEILSSPCEREDQDEVTSNIITAASVDNTVRNYISSQGYGPQFIHSTGHGLGLEIHEQPSLYYTNDQVILPNMTITIEPGIYLPGQFGYRYENTILTTDHDPIILTQ